MPPKEPRDDVEGFGTVYLEAGLFGVPCIGTRVGGVPEAILEGRTGILVEPDDAEGLRDAIVALLNDPVKRQWMGENARARAAAFSWENGTRKVLSLFSGDLE
jgi:glycosyltransferase involved in cell wall biosynthesis